MGALRCDVCLVEDGPVSSSPMLPVLLKEHLGIKAAEGISSCDGCNQLLNLWDEFSREARTNLGGAQQSTEPQCASSVLHKSMESQTDNLPSELNANFTRHFQGICDMCNTTFKNIESFNDHLNCMHSQHNFILFTNNHIIEDSNENKLQIVEFKKRSMYKKSYSCVYMCNNCNKTFSSKQKLETHINIEHDCGDSFTKKSCDICVNDLDPGKNIFDHLMESHIQKTDEKLKCPFCEYSFDTKDDIECHIDSLHFKIKMKFQCNLPCKKIVSTKKKLDYHINKIHLHKKSCLTCDYCSKKFARKYSLRKHIVAKHLPKRNFETQVTESKIQFTPDSTKDESIIGKPLLTPINPSNTSCALCNKKFKSIAQLNMHMKTIHSPSTSGGLVENSSYKCGICQKCFIKDSDLSSHILKEHQSITNSSNQLKRKNKSEITSVNDVNQSKIIKIQKNSNQVVSDRYDYFKEDGAFYCNYCHKITPLEMAMRLHLIKFHKIDVPIIKADDIHQPQEPDVENISESNIDSNTSEVNKNIETEKNDKPESPTSSDLKCNLCTEVLENFNDFIEHLKTHVRNKDAAPILTSKTQVRNKNAASIITPKTPIETTSVSVDEIPRSCSKCNEKFVTLDDLNKHEPECNNYASEFMCTLCTKSFTTQLGLSVHNQVHIDEVIVSKNSSAIIICDECGKSFNSKQGLAVHKKYIHVPKYLINKKFGESSKTVSVVDNEASIFVCKFCDLPLPNEGEFKQHLMNHVKRL